MLPRNVRPKFVGKVIMPFDVSGQFVEDVLVTAFDAGYGGSLYWGRLSGGYKQIQKFAHDSGEAQIIEDCEGHKEEHLFTMADFLKGLQLWINFMDERGTIDRISDIDGDDADAIVQFGVFGKLVYG